MALGLMKRRMWLRRLRAEMDNFANSRILRRVSLERYTITFRVSTLTMCERTCGQASTKPCTESISKKHRDLSASDTTEGCSVCERGIIGPEGTFIGSRCLRAISVDTARGQ